MTAPSATPLLRLPLALLAAIGAGVLLWLAFPPVGFGPSAAGGVALLTAALWRASVRRGARARTALRLSSSSRCCWSGCG